MTTQHTPGPWWFHLLAGNHDYAIYCEATGHDIALVRDANEANARLIAAAPAMLAALEVIIGDSDAVAGLRQSQWEAACAAIAAARGEG